MKVIYLLFALNMLNQVLPQCNNAIMQEQQQAEQKAGEEDVVHESELE